MSEFITDHPIFVFGCFIFALLVLDWIYAMTVVSKRKRKNSEDTK